MNNKKIDYVAQLQDILGLYESNPWFKSQGGLAGQGKQAVPPGHKFLSWQTCFMMYWCYYPHISRDLVVSLFSANFGNIFGFLYGGWGDVQGSSKLFAKIIFLLLKKLLSAKLYEVQEHLILKQHYICVTLRNHIKVKSVY